MPQRAWVNPVAMPGEPLPGPDGEVKALREAKRRFASDPGVETPARAPIAGTAAGRAP